MKRLFVLLAALAAVSAVVAGAGSAAPTPTPCTYSGDPGYLPYQTVNGAMVVPAGQTCKFIGHVTGSVTVEKGALLKIFGSTIDGNVYVNGGHFQAANYGSTIRGSLNISGSDNSDMNGIWTPYSDTHINGNINYDHNAGSLYFEGPFQTLIGGSLNVTGGSPAPTGAPYTIHAPTV
jgi:hypothetical protein